MRTSRVAVLWPGDRDASLSASRFSRVAEALGVAGLSVLGAPYADERADEVRALLSSVDGVLVWVNPIHEGRDRSILDRMLEDVAAAGVLVSAHPETIRKLGTKEVLHRTRDFSWGSDTRLYRSFAALREELPQVLAKSGARVLKRARGNGGDGVWKIEPVLGDAQRGDVLSHDSKVFLRHAARGSVELEVSLQDALRLFEPFFEGAGFVVDQPFQPRLADGMVRCYLVRDRVAGFGEQRVNALFPAPPGADRRSAPEPGPRVYYPPSRPDFQTLKASMETEWIPALCATLDLPRDALPLLWDADFLYGLKTPEGADTYVLCEINVSSVFPFPDDALPVLALATRAALDPNVLSERELEPHIRR